MTFYFSINKKESQSASSFDTFKECFFGHFKIECQVPNKAFSDENFHDWIAEIIYAQAYAHYLRLPPHLSRVTFMI